MKLFIFNKEIYQLNNTPFELNFTYKEYLPVLFYFKVGEDIKSLVAEIIVGLLPEFINKAFKQIDFKDSIGTLNLEKEKGIIIKIPKDLNEDLYDFSILFCYNTNALYHQFDVQIAYDKIEFLSIGDDTLSNIPSIIPLFRVNPYNEIKNLENNKYIYILLYNVIVKNQINIYIKKPMLYSDVKLNKINILPQLSENNKEYYY